MKSGIIYGFFFGNRNSAYIGSTTDPKDRRYRHMRALQNGKHACPQFQRTFDKYGEAEMTYEIIEHIAQDFSHDDTPLRECEREWIKHYLKDGWKVMNTMLPSPVNKWTHGQETRQKLSDYFTGRPGAPRTPEWNRKVGAALKGRPKTEKQKELNRLGHIGKRTSDATKSLLAQLRKDQTFPLKPLACTVCGTGYIGKHQKPNGRCETCRHAANLAKYRRYHLSHPR